MLQLQVTQSHNTEKVNYCICIDYSVVATTSHNDPVVCLL